MYLEHQVHVILIEEIHILHDVRASMVLQARARGVDVIFGGCSGQLSMV